jgi:thioredoxin 2
MMETSPTIVCPHCQSVNRAPLQRLASGDVPDCGRCHKPMFSGHPVELGDSRSFDRMVSRTQLPVVVDFWAAWCGPCRAMAPQFEAAAQKLEPRVRFAKLDTEAAQDVAARYGIRSIPTMILFDDGREVARQSGAMGSADIESFIRAHTH